MNTIRAIWLARQYLERLEHVVIKEQNRRNIEQSASFETIKAHIKPSAIETALLDACIVVSNQEDPTRPESPGRLEPRDPIPCSPESGCSECFGAPWETR